MKLGVPWSVKGIRPEARESAREAARRSGMSLGDWLNSVILQQANEIDPHDEDEEYTHELEGVHDRLDDLTRKIDQFARKNPANYAPKGVMARARGAALQLPQAVEADQLAALIERLDTRIEQFVNFARPVSALPPMPAPMMPPQGMPQMHPLAQQMAQPMLAPHMMHQPMHAPLQQSAPHMRAPMHQPSLQPMMPSPGHQAYAPAQNRVSAAPPALDRAVAEIAARQRALNGAPAPVRGPASAAQPQAFRQPEPVQESEARPLNQQPLPSILQQPPAPQPAMVPVPTQNISGLEDQLRRITDQIETLRKPGVEEAINALRGELGDISRALNDAMPRTAIDTIEKQIHGLTQRIAEGRQNGADASQLGNIEHGLAEVRDALRGLTPAESLVGFNDAVHGLAHKIDLIVAQKDPATLSQLEHAITMLRDMTQHVASNETVNSLASQVHMLAEKVEHIGGTGVAHDALNSLEHRINALADGLAERQHNGTIIPPRLEALVQSLSDKIELIQQSRGDSVAATHLEDRIVRLVERLDASDTRLSHLEAIERGLGDLLVHMQEIQANRGMPPMQAPGDMHVDVLKNDMARTQSALDQVNGTLGHVVDRLAQIEREFRNPRPQAASQDSPAQQPEQTPAFHRDGPMRVPAHAGLDPEEEPLELTQVFGKLAARAVEETQAQLPPRLPHAGPFEVAQTPKAATAHQPARMQAPQAQQEPPQQSRRRPQAARHEPIDPTLPPDQPLEPGSGNPRLRGGARIAHPNAGFGAGPADPASGKSNFIAAARRAAQVAVKQASTALPSRGTAAAAPAAIIEDHELGFGPKPSLRQRLRGSMKSIIIAISIIALVVGSVQLFGSWLGSDQKTVKPLTEIDTGEPADNTAMSPQPGTPVAPASSQPSMFAPPMLNPAPAMPAPGSTSAKPGDDVTGSVNRMPVRQVGAMPNQPLQLPTTAPASTPARQAETLPVALGSNKLRTAALGGDANAAYEVALRYAEGRGVPANPEEAARWYERSASRGVTLAQFRYATLLEKGQGVKKDLGAARRLYLAAAGKGNAKAMHNLAVLYAEGIDGKPDYNTASGWFRKAARMGVSDSMYNLGVLCARGLGAEKNLVESFKWFSLAAQQGDKEAARKRDEVQGQLDPEALAQGQTAVRTFQADPQPQEAIAVPMPAGGWDDAGGTGVSPSGKATTRAAKPLTLGMAGR